MHACHETLTPYTNLYRCLMRWTRFSGGSPRGPLRVNQHRLNVLHEIRQRRAGSRADGDRIDAPQRSVHTRAGKVHFAAGAKKGLTLSGVQQCVLINNSGNGCESVFVRCVWSLQRRVQTETETLYIQFGFASEIASGNRETNQNTYIDTYTYKYMCIYIVVSCEHGCKGDVV